MAVAVERATPLASRRSITPKRRSICGRLSRSGISRAHPARVIVLAAIIGPRLWGQDPLAQNNLVRLTNPTLAHPLGTDKYRPGYFLAVAYRSALVAHRGGNRLPLHERCWLSHRHIRGNEQPPGGWRD